MKKYTLMTVLSFLMTACGGDSTEMPGTYPEDNNVENSSKDKVNPTLGDVITLNKKIADAFNNKPTLTQADLEEFMGNFTFEKCTYKNNKYLIVFKDGTQTVLDLNNYKSKASSKANSRSAGHTESRAEVSDSLLSNAKVLFWESSPMGTTQHDRIGKLVEDYVGVENVTVLSGENCDLQSVVNMAEYATVIINALGFNDEWLVTGLEYTEHFDYSSLQEYISIYSTVVDGKLKHYYMVNQKFVSKFVAPINERAIIFNVSPSGFEKGVLADAFQQSGFSTYIGFDNMTNEELTGEKAEYFFTAMLEGHVSVQKAADEYLLKTEEIKIDQIENPVSVSCKIKGSDKVYYPYTTATDKMAIKRIVEQYKLGLDLESLEDDNRLAYGYDGRIIILDLSYMQLEGAISEQFSHLTELIMLDVSGNSLTGNIPSELGNFTKMTAINLSNNELTGNVPTSFRGYYDANKSINVRDNQLTGQIPFGKYSDNKEFFQFDHRYEYTTDGKVYDNQTGLWFVDEPID